jgi:hypothetical protein
MDDKTLSWYLERASHFLAIERPDIWLVRAYSGQLKAEDCDIPWAYASEIKVLSDPTRFSVTAKHPSGLVFHWDVELGRPDTTAGQDIDLTRLIAALQKMPSHLLEEFKRLLLENVKRCEDDVEYLRQNYVSRRDRARAFRYVVESIVTEGE